MKAHKLPSGSYRVKVYLYCDNKGKSHYKSFTAPTKKEAEYLASQYNLSHEEALQIVSMTFEDAMNIYIAERTTVLSKASVKKYKSMQRADHLKNLLPLKINKIKTADIQSVVSTMCVNYSPKTVCDYYGFVVGILKRFGVEKKFKVVLPKKKKVKRYLPSDDDVQKVIEAAKGTYMELPVYLGSICCLRRGEIASFSKSDILGNNLHINKTMVQDEANKWVIKPPKSIKGDRFVPLPPFLLEKIQNMPGDTLGLKPNQITSGFAHVRDRAGVKSFRFHDLRHYGASVLSKLGVNTYMIMTICGWQSEKMLNEIYRYQFTDEMKETLDLVSDYYDENGKKSENHATNHATEKEKH